MILSRYQDADVRTLRRRRWQRDYSGLGAFEVESSAAGAAAATTSSSGTRSPGEAIFVGVTTGVLVWFITNMLNKTFGGGK